MAVTFRVLKRKTIYKGKVLQLTVDRIIEPGNLRVIRELVRHSGSVVVLPHLPDGKVVLVRQFRYAARKALWELVAGSLKPGETPAQAARRELLEETGYRARSFKLLFSFYPSPGFLNERMHLVEARGLKHFAARPEADERIRVGKFTSDQLRQWLFTYKLEDAKTLIGLLWLLDRTNVSKFRTRRVPIRPRGLGEGTPALGSVRILE
jgi:ADP-ribose pyrophosphatase